MDTLAAYGWRLIVLAVVAVGVLWLLQRLWVVMLALVVGLFISRGLAAPDRWLRGLGLPPALAALVSVVGALGLVGMAGWLIAPSVSSEFETLGPTLDTAVDDLERWLVDDAPFAIEEDDLAQYREQAGDAIGNAFRSSSGTLVTGAVVVVEGLTGVLLGLLVSFFFLKDGSAIRSAMVRAMPERRQDLVWRLTGRAWQTIGGYLQGAVVLGVVEAIIIGLTLTIVGAELAIPVAVITLAAAFVPIAGAIFAGVIAVLVALATAGTGQAVVVLAVVVVVQQLDNDLLAPVIYGRALQLHPLAVLLSIVAGGALFGAAGTVLAVPVTAVAVNLISEARSPTVEAAAAEASDRER
ncbi:MAG: AI-2E family transporter [Acidimicrobiales bacterium]